MLFQIQWRARWQRPCISLRQRWKPPGTWWYTSSWLGDASCWRLSKQFILFFHSMQEVKMVKDGKMLTSEGKIVALRRRNGSLLEVRWCPPVKHHKAREVVQKPSSNYPTHNNNQPPSQGHHQNHQGDPACNQGTNGHKQQVPKPPNQQHPSYFTPKPIKKS